MKTKIIVPPTKFGLPLKKSIAESLGEKYEGMLHKQLGIGLAVTNVKKVGEGKILPTKPGALYPVTFELLTFKPETHELAFGEVIDNTEFGAFVRLGPMDGLVHVSQLMNDYVSYDEKNSLFTGKESRKALKEGDLVLAKIISVAMAEGKENKIGLTMRQPGLGSLSWIAEEKKKAAKAVKKTTKKK